jgi:OOP family OmpA-OmpF porin
MKTRLYAIAIAVAVALPAVAADNGFYLGGSIAQSAIDTGAIGNVKINDDTNGYKVFGGYRFITFLGGEVSYADLGTAKSSNDLNEFGAKGWQAAAMGYIPFGIGDIFAKYGVMGWKGDYTSTVGGVRSTVAHDGTDPLYGVGLQFRIKSWAIRGEAEYLDIKSTDKIYMYSIGASYTF